MNFFFLKIFLVLKISCLLLKLAPDFSFTKMILCIFTNYKILIIFSTVHLQVLFCHISIKVRGRVVNIILNSFMYLINLIKWL